MAKKIMLQGTMSSVGKSVLTAALLRVLKQDGYSCAPFKSQNMALNSYVTPDGSEIGRAQAMQAEAAGIEPSVEMNPILLKPMGDTFSQVVVNGKPVANMRAKEYYRRKQEFIPDIMSAFRKLEERYDVIVVEGAGSPAEINLRENDIVNMGLADMIDTPVLLIGDIDRGGVFAQLYGTWALLEPHERKRIKGLIINKFRGDRSILEPGFDMLSAICPVPVLGVMPFTELDIDEEDSLAERLISKKERSIIDIAVIRLPHISNFTDFAPLERANGISLRYVRSAKEFGEPDMVIVPGTKNAIGDLLWLRSCGLGEMIHEHASAGGYVLGICGGYQMLGQTLSDPYATESADGLFEKGLGLLPVETVFEKHKITERSHGITGGMGDGVWSLPGMAVTGYEIHMGVTRLFSGSCFIILSDGSHDGCCVGKVAGTYMHGLFDSEQFLEAFCNKLFAEKGLRSPSLHFEESLRHRKQAEYDKLADIMRNNCDINYIYRTAGI